MTERLLRSKLVLKWWVIFFFMSGVASFIAGGVAGFIVGFALGVFGAITKNSELAHSITGVACPVAGVLASIPVSYLCFSFCVGKLFKENGGGH